MHAVDAEGNSLFEHTDTETLKAAIKLATGYVRTFVDLETGQLVAVPKSISWGAMDQTKFNEFFEHALQRDLPALAATGHGVRRCPPRAHSKWLTASTRYRSGSHDPGQLSGLFTTIPSSH